jgi:hypothetical protein
MRNETIGEAHRIPRRMPETMVLTSWPRASAAYKLSLIASAITETECYFMQQSQAGTYITPSSLVGPVDMNENYVLHT